MALLSTWRYFRNAHLRAEELLVRKITRITNQRKNDSDGTFQYRIDLSPPRAVIRYRSNVSLHLASDYYPVNIDSQLAPALMRQRIARLCRTCRRRCLSSSTLDRVISCKHCVAPSMFIHRFIIKHNRTS